MRIAIDGMGGDNAPQAVVNGVIQALNEFNDLEFYITGPEDVIKEQLKKENYAVMNRLVCFAPKTKLALAHRTMVLLNYPKMP